MTTRKMSRVRLGLGAVLAFVSTAGGVVAVPKVALAAPWTVTALSDPGGPTATQLGQSLVGPGITVNSATFVGDNRAGGTFNDPAASVGLASGVVLSSGQVHDVIGPNTIPSSGVDLAQLGDADLNALLPAGQLTHDATVLP